MQRLEEFIDNLFLPRFKTGSVVVYREHDAHGCILNFILWITISRQMNSVHFKVVSDSINSMFRSSMEVKLHTLESIRSSKVFLWYHWVEMLCVLASFIDGNLRCMTIPRDLNVILLVGVHFHESIFNCRDLMVSIDTTRQINRRLVCELSTLIVLYVERWPVSSIRLVIVWGSLRDWSYKGCYRNKFHSKECY